MADPMVIEELGGPKRRVAFEGRDLPERPVTVAGEQRATQTHYPGTRQASVQVQGTREDPIVLRGWFHLDPFSTTTVADADNAILGSGPRLKVALLRGIMQTGGLCQLTWGSAIVRTGRVRRVETEYHEDPETRYRYQVAFDVDQPNEAVALRAATRRDVNQKLKTEFDAVERAAGAALDVAAGINLLAGVVR